MKRFARRNVFLNFTDRELKIIEQRVNGMKPEEIARQTGVSRQAIYAVTIRAYRKAGLNNMRDLTQWAVENALDAPVAPDTPENMPVKEPWVRGNLPIKMGRVRRLPA